MHIITLTEKKYNDFSKNYNIKNYKQTIEFANSMMSFNYQKLYLGLIDENDNVIAASLILEQRTNLGYKIGYVPNGFLIEYENKLLLENFTKEIKKYLQKLNYIYIRLNPKFNYKIINKNNCVLNYNSTILDTIKNLGYIQLESKDSLNKYNAILNFENDINDIYRNFNRNLKRKIQDSNLMGITYYQKNDINKFYELIKKKKTEEFKYYENLLRYFNKENCKFDIYFSKLNTEIYLNNYRYIYKKEQEKNYKLQEKIRNINIKKTNKLINNKMISDKLLNKYKSKVIEASDLFSKYPDGLIIGTCAIIEYDDTIYFIEEGYEEKLRNIHSLPMLKWEIIKKYYNKGIRKFDLGIVPSNDNSQKYYGIYQSKIGFNPKIYEYCDDFDLIINKHLYNLLKKFPNIQKKSR